MGCAPLTGLEKEERAWKANIDLENWENCEAIYSHNLQATWHIGHSHDHPRSRMQNRHDIRADLVTNRCRWILGEYWIRY